MVPHANLEQRGRDEPVRGDPRRVRTHDVPTRQKHLYQLAQRRFLDAGLHRAVVRAFAHEVKRRQRSLHRLPPRHAGGRERGGERVANRAERERRREPRDAPKQNRQFLPGRDGFTLQLLRVLVIPVAEINARDGFIREGRPRDDRVEYRAKRTFRVGRG